MYKIFAAACAIVLFAASFVCANPIPVRGIVEGFYGQPWSHQQRLDLMSFCRTHNLNAYIYAPKDDPYHRAQWRDPYPIELLQQLGELIRAADRNGVQFIFAVSPGVDTDFSDRDLQAMIQKLSTVHELGCKRFAIFFDDIDNLDGKAQADFINRINRRFVKLNPDIQPLITVPTEYYFDNMFDGGAVKEYTRGFSGTLDDDVLVLCTGDGVVQPNINVERLNEVDRIYRRRLGIWWNYPVNDYCPQKLALGPVEGIPADVPAVFFNPMSAFEMSKLSLCTAADFAVDPQHYDPQSSWQRAIDELFGGLSNEMRIFAQHSQHLKNDWADCGRDDAPILRAEFDRLLNGEDRAQTVETMLYETLDAVQLLKARLPDRFLVECILQLDQLERIINADLLAVKLIQHYDPSLEKSLRQASSEIEQHAQQAAISDDCAVRFIQDVLK